MALVPSGNTSTSCPSSCSSRYALSGWAGTPPARDHSVPTHRELAEEVLGEAVDGAQQLGLDAVHDDRRVGRDRAGVVGDQQRTAFEGDVLEPLPLGAEPVAVDRVVQRAGEGAHGLAPAPGVDVGATLVEGDRLVGGEVPGPVDGRVGVRRRPRPRRRGAGAAPSGDAPIAKR